MNFEIWCSHARTPTRLRTRTRSAWLRAKQSLNIFCLSFASMTWSGELICLNLSLGLNVGSFLVHITIKPLLQDDFVHWLLKLCMRVLCRFCWFTILCCWIWLQWMIIFTVYNEDVQLVQNCLIFSGEICSHIPQVTCPRLGDFLHDCNIRIARGRY